MHSIHILPNGLKLLTVPIAGAKTATVLVMFATGSKHETRQTSGLSHFLEHMFFKGTVKRPTTMDISGALDKVGAEFNAFTSKEFTGYWVKAAAQHTAVAFDVVSDMLLRSKFAPEEIEREKGVILAELNMYLDDPRSYIEELFENCLYGNQPAGWDTIGTKQNIKNFQQRDFLNYFHNQYGADSAYLVVAGKVPAGIKALANKYFGALTKCKYQRKLKVIEKQSRPQIKLQYKKTDQAHLSLGVRAFAFGHQNQYAQKLLAVTLGGSMSSRLFTNLRERHGLCYYVRTSEERYTDSGYLVTRAGVHTDKLEQTLKIIVAEYQKIKDELIRPAELNKVKQLLEGRTTMNLESSDELAHWYGAQAAITHQQTKKQPLQEPAAVIKKLKAVTARQIQQTAKQIFQPNRLNLAIIGPYRNSKKFTKLLKLK